MKKIHYKDIATTKFIKDAITRSDFPGFEKDYLAIHALIKKYRIKNFVEIGTSSGVGTKIIANAMGIRRWILWKNKGINLYSIDVLPGTDSKIIYPEREDGHPKKAGEACNLPYLQLYGDSTKFNFKKYYPIGGWFIDGKHNFEYVYKDTLQALKSKPKIIIWHDKQINGVKKGIEKAMEKSKYKIYDLMKTRLIYAVKSN